jgi:crossover junction endodeoxyribonuclease RuvC
MIVLGIDPGLATIGYGVVESSGARQRALDYGVLTTPAKMPLPGRLGMIYEKTLELYDRFQPDVVALEELFFNTNITTGIAVAHARGAILTALTQRTQALYEYTPLQVKQSVVGYGRAQKQQVQLMVRSILKLKETPRPDDAADALAVALCYVNSGMLDRTFKIR